MTGSAPSLPLVAGDHYVAMGSSFAAGPGIAPRSPDSPRGARRSAANYASLLAGRLGLDLTDVSFSGVTAAQLVDGTRRHPAQIEALTPDTRLVTVTCGGNDVGYIPVLSLSSLRRTMRAVPRLRRFVDEYVAATDARFELLPATFDRLLTAVRDRAPEATVVVVDYPTLLPPEGVPAAPLPDGIADWGRRTAQRLADETAEAAERAGCLLVTASIASRDHHAWAAEPWSHGFRFGRGVAAYHPNAEGMRAMADLIERALRKRSQAPSH